MSAYHPMTQMSISPAQCKPLKGRRGDRILLSARMSSSLLVFENGGADFLGAILGGMTWSVYAVLFLWYITLERKASNDHKYHTRRLTFALTALFCIATLTCAVDFGQGYLLQVPNADPTLIAAWRLYVASTTLLAVVDFLSQMILIYRCWNIWSQNYYVVSPPVLLAIASLRQLVAAGFLGSVSGGVAEPVYHIAVPLATAGISLSMSVNTLVTGLIAGKIWVQSRQLKVLRDGGEKKEDEPYNRVIMLMVESGLMNFVIQLLYLVLNLLKNPAFSLVETCTGITPTLLGIRVITGRSFDSYTQDSRSLAFVGRGAGDTTASMEADEVQPGEKSGDRSFNHEFGSKEVTIIGRENEV
ncbi:hypothetical protein B0H16DRAFT_1881709 [Mycena metata]|uniref:Uncharacterized protein n=1 Tax=Mycena metata TaxID=1033252 RepID=A0AAD7JR72_9AGAR|nr:hypothetical protein B0H16DRAFT_1881709 [Mycena metata]